MRIACGLLPHMLNAHALPGSFAIVIDVLRATTTIAQAIAHGATGVTPLVSVDEAHALRTARPGCLLGGERGGVRIAGFDLANSPAEYGAHVAGKHIGFTTTNGTKALNHCRGAARIATAAFVNLSATCELVLKASPKSVSIVCAGTDGLVTREDVICAGAIIAAMMKQDVVTGLDDQARIAMDVWQGLNVRRADLVEELRWCQGAHNLLRCGFGADIVFAAGLDTVPVATELDLPSWTIRRAETKAAAKSA